MDLSTRDLPDLLAKIASLHRKTQRLLHIWEYDHGLRLTEDESEGATPEDDAAYEAFVEAHKEEHEFLDVIADNF